MELEPLSQSLGERESVEVKYAVGVGVGGGVTVTVPLMLEEALGETM